MSSREGDPRPPWKEFQAELTAAGLYVEKDCFVRAGQALKIS